MSKKEEKKICFVMMPFGKHFDDYYQEIYLPAIEECDLIALRADDIYKPSTIVQDIWNLIQSASIIIADLSEKNANVFYELGLAHASVKPVVLISESMNDVPFDLRALRVITFDKNNWNWGQRLKRDIQNSIEETLKSPLKSVIPSFLEVSDKNKKVTKATKDYLELKNEIELLKLQINSGEISKSLEHSEQVINLTKREIQVLKLIGKGYTSREIGNELYIAQSTVEAHRRNLIDKTGARNSKDLVRFAFENGIL